MMLRGVPSAVAQRRLMAGCDSRAAVLGQARLNRGGWMMKMLRMMVLAALWPAAAWVQAEDWRYPRLPGYVVAHSQDQGRQHIVEWVPAGQSLQNWRTMVTLQVFGHQSLAAFQGRMGDFWRRACPGGRMTPLRDGVQNGHRFAFWLLSCNRNPATGQPEYTWVKAIESPARLYVAQHAYRYPPSEAEVESTTLWMIQVQVGPSGHDGH